MCQSSIPGHCRVGVCAESRMRRSGLVLFTVMAVVLTVLVGTWLMHHLQLEFVQSVRADLQAWQPVLTGVRVTVILLVALGWNRGVAVLARIGILHPAKAGSLIALRVRIVLWLVALELVLGQGLPARIVQLATGQAS